MSGCCSLTAIWDKCLRCHFTKSGLQSTMTDLQDGTIMHCWVPKNPIDSKPNLLLIHGVGPNATWQWNETITFAVRYFNVYVPDLVFFGDSYTTRPERTESFQAQSVMKVMEANSVKRISVVGLSYGGFVAYSMASMFRDSVDKVVICGSGVYMEEKDLEDGTFSVSDLEEACEILVPRTADKLRELMGYCFHKIPPLLTLTPSCLLEDFINATNTDYEHKRDLIRAIPKDRKLSNIQKISQPTLLIWGEYDRIFSIELAHRLKRHLGDNAKLVLIKDAGHAVNFERTKEYCSLLKDFLCH